MVTAERMAERIGDPIAQLAALLERWRLKPTRNARWLHGFCHAFEGREPDAWARYERVAALGVEIGRLLDLSPWSRAVIRGSALLSALAGCEANPAQRSRRGRTDAQRWEDKLRGWRWLQTCASVLDALRPGYDDSQPLSRHGKHTPIESRVLALAEDFDELTADQRGAPRVRIPEALRALRAGASRRHDPQLVELLWSEAGQAACAVVLRRRGTLYEDALSELKASVRLLERGQRVPTQKVRHQKKSDKEALVASPDLATAKEDGAREDVERREEMSRTTMKEEESANTGRDGIAEGAASLPARIAAAVSEMEEIRAAAARGLEALASVGPAMEELSTLVARLQASVQWVQGSGDASGPGQGRGDLRSIDLRVECPQGPLDVEEVAGAIDTLRDLHDVRVRDQGSSWAVLRARADSNADLSILEAKVNGSLARHLCNADESETPKVTFLERE